MKQKHLRLTARRREGLIGLFFLAPFLIGTLLCFAFPTISSFLLSFGATDTQTAGFHIQMTGFENYSRAFFKDTNFVPYLLDSIQDMLVKTPLILVFSLLIAILLSKVKHFKGFSGWWALLPFLLGNGQVLRQMMREGIDTQILSLTGSNLIPQDMLAYIGQDFLGVVDSLFSIIVTVLWSCGVQILLFLAAIQSISPRFMNPPISTAPTSMKPSGKSHCRWCCRSCCSIRFTPSSIRSPIPPIPCSIISKPGRSPRRIMASPPPWAGFTSCLSWCSSGLWCW